MKWLLCYISAVLIFALAYWVLWEKSPDSFIVHESLNAEPFVSIDNFLWEEGTFEPSIHVNLSKLLSEYGTKLNQYDDAREQIATLQADIEETKKELYVLDNRRDSAIESNINAYEANEIEPYLQRSRELNRSLVDAERQLQGVEPIHPDFMDLVRKVGDVKVEIANHNVQIARKRSDIASYIVSHYASFAPLEIRNRHLELRLAERDFTDRVFQYEESLRAIRSAATVELRQLKSELSQRLGFIDFLYFSIGISTTTTFGDVVANNRLVRGLVSSQLLLCLIIVSLFLRDLAKAVKT